jgi:mxaJ protein
MSSRFLDRRRSWVWGVGCSLVAALVLLQRSFAGAAPYPISQTPHSRVLRICADPNNLPFSNARGEGFENEIAKLIAREMGARIAYSWWAQRRGFLRNTLDAGTCDVVLGLPAGMPGALATRPYYRSSYVFVSRKDRALRIRSFDDPALRTLRIGVQLIGDDYANSPPAHALSRRGLVGNVTGYTVYGNYAHPNPPARIMHAVAQGEVDVAIVWGPLAGYFATRERVALEIDPVSSPADLQFLPFAFDIAMAVRRNHVRLRDELDAIIRRIQPEIERILDAYGVPRVSGVAPPRAS